MKGNVRENVSSQIVNVIGHCSYPATRRSPGKRQWKTSPGYEGTGATSSERQTQHVWYLVHNAQGGCHERSNTGVREGAPLHRLGKTAVGVLRSKQERRLCRQLPAVWFRSIAVRATSDADHSGQRLYFLSLRAELDVPHRSNRRPWLH